MTAELANVGTPCSAYNAMAEMRCLIDDLLGGTARMREAGAKWLPPEHAEKGSEYTSRLNRSFLYGALSDTIEKFVSKPFSKKVVVKGEMPEALANFAEDVDMMGTSLTEFARAVLRDGLEHGLSFIFPDYSKVGEEGPDGDLALPNKAQERASGARPYFQHFHSSTVIGWRSEVRNGREVLTQLRVKEERVEPKGEYGEEEIERVRLFTETYVETFEKSAGSTDWTPKGKVPHTLGRIPLVPFYVAPTGFMTACPPFESLAWMNLRHWQLESDLGNIIHVACVPILHRTGITAEDNDKGSHSPMEVGSYRIVTSAAPDARLEYVEPTGAGVKLGQDERQKVEAHMEILGLAPAMERTADQTATARGIDDTNAKSSIQGWIRVLESALESAYRIAAEIARVELPEDFSIDIFQDFGLSARAQSDVTALLQMKASGTISHETFLVEMKKRAVLDEGLDVAKEIEDTKRDGPPLGLIGAGGFGAPPREEEPEPEPVAA